MNILILTTHLNSGGITSYVISLARGLKACGYNVVVASSGGSCLGMLYGKGIAHIPIPIRTKSELSPKIACSFMRLLRVIKENNIQIVHSQTRVTQVLGFLLSKFAGVTFVSTCHGFFRPKLFRKIFPCWGKRVIAISKQVRRHLIDDFNIGAQEIDLVYNGIDVSSCRMTKDPDSKSEIKRQLGLDNKFVIGIIARLSPVKGHKFLISAFKEILKVTSNAVLFIVGDGPDKNNLLRLVKKLDISDHVVFHPSVENTREMLKAIDIFCMPSLKEGLGLSILEAFASGIPVIASSIGGIKEIVEHKKTGILVAPSDEGAIKDAVIDLIADSELRKHMVENASELVKDVFSLDEMIAKTKGVYVASLS